MSEARRLAGDGTPAKLNEQSAVASATKASSSNAGNKMNSNKSNGVPHESEGKKTIDLYRRLQEVTREMSELKMKHKQEKQTLEFDIRKQVYFAGFALLV